MLELLDSKNGSLQHNAAFALYGLADNEVGNPFSLNGASEYGFHFPRPQDSNILLMFVDYMDILNIF